MTEICPENLFRMVDDDQGAAVMAILETQPESLEACLLTCYLLQRGLREAADDDEIYEIYAWAESALDPHSQVRQLWCCDEVSRYLASQSQFPGWEEIWSRARAIAASEMNI